MKNKTCKESNITRSEVINTVRKTKPFTIIAKAQENVGKKRKERIGKGRKPYLFCLVKALNRGCSQKVWSSRPVFEGAFGEEKKKKTKDPKMYGADVA